jgi:hypothetical protein
MCQNKKKLSSQFTAMLILMKFNARECTSSNYVRQAALNNASEAQNIMNIREAKIY